MSNNVRLLNTFQFVEDFLINELDIEITKENYHIITDITGIELSLYNFNESSVTKNSKIYRNKFYRSEAERLELKNIIVTELIEKQNIYSDDEIELGIGGAVPNSINGDKQAYIVIGLPASGKSTVTNKIAEKYGAIVLDSDYAKRKLPEFKSVSFGATLVHDESDEIIFGNNKSDGFTDSLFDIAVQTNANVVIPKIGKSYESILALAKKLIAYNYVIHLTLVELDRKKSTQRALNRYIRHGRYVPLSLIYDDYNNYPSETYVNLRENYNEFFRTFGVVSTDVEKGDNYIVKESMNNNPASLF